MVELNTVGVGLGLSFTTQTLPDGNIVPAINSVDVNVDIDRNDLDIHIWGNIWSDFASMFEVFFKGAVVDGINSAINDVLTNEIPTYANSYLASTDGIS